MPIIPSEEINHRADFALLCTARGVRTAVEVGTDRGVFARQFMDRFNGELLCVDPYEPGGEWPGVRSPDLMQAVLALQPFHGRVRFVSHASPGVIAKLPDWQLGTVDFVYIDGDHTYEGCAADIAGWWAALPPHGILAGHDYDPTHPGVMRAVEEFSERTGAFVRIVRGDSEPSWYAYKTEPQRVYRRWYEEGDVFNPRRG